MLRLSSDNGDCSCYDCCLSAVAIHIPAVGGGMHFYGVVDKNPRRLMAYELYGGLQLRL